MSKIGQILLLVKCALLHVSFIYAQDGWAQSKAQMMAGVFLKPQFNLWQSIADYYRVNKGFNGSYGMQLEYAFKRNGVLVNYCDGLQHYQDRMIEDLPPWKVSYTDFQSRYRGFGFGILRHFYIVPNLNISCGFTTDFWHTYKIKGVIHRGDGIESYRNYTFEGFTPLIQVGGVLRVSRKMKSWNLYVAPSFNTVTKGYSYRIGSYWSGGLALNSRVNFAISAGANYCFFRK